MTLNSTRIKAALWREVFLLLISVTVLSCAKSPSQSEQDKLAVVQISPHRCFKQEIGGSMHPAEFFTCDKNFIQCCCSHKNN